MARKSRDGAVLAQRPETPQMAMFSPHETNPIGAEALTARATLEEKIIKLEQFCAPTWDEPTCRLTVSACNGSIEGLIERLELVERRLARMRRDLLAEKTRWQAQRLREYRQANPPTTSPSPKPATVPLELAEMARAAWDAADYEAFEEWFKRRTFEEDMDDLPSSVDRLQKWDFENLREFYEWATQDSIREGGETDGERF